MEIECEGREEQDGFIRAIRSFKDPIVVDDVKVSNADGTGEFKSFRIIPRSLAEELMEGFDTQTTYLKRMASKGWTMLDKQDHAMASVRTFPYDMDGMTDSVPKDTASIHVQNRGFRSPHAGAVRAGPGPLP